MSLLGFGHKNENSFVAAILCKTNLVKCFGPRLRLWTLCQSQAFQKEKNCIYLLVMTKYWGKQMFNLGSFPEGGQKQKTEERKEKTERW